MNFKQVMLFVLLGGVFSCQNTTKYTEMDQQEIKELSDLISEERYHGLFNYGEHRKKIDSIWEVENSLQKLEFIYSDTTEKSEIRFLAAEIIFVKKENYKWENNSEILIEIYIDALKNTSSITGKYDLSGNMWGFLYDLDDVGVLGARFIEFGEDAKPALMDLLKNNDQIDYEGSKEATMGNDLNYRIKDFAAFYLSKIAGIKITFYQDLTKREQEIERFKAELEKRP